jgi:hypothetical protein
MPSVKELQKIIEATPHNQPILLEGIHGIGKSESLRDHFVAQGYRMITLFVGQMADAGDMIGLPDRTEVEIEMIDKDGTVRKGTTKITEFCPPKWWPLDLGEKVIIFLDEINRGKQEIMQCLMDMILNRKLNGLDLPENARIIGAMNPLDDGYYQVDELDPAFMDRWNIYQFKPAIEEWMDWGVKKKIHANVLGFIAKHSDHLDPPDSKQCVATKVYPSRRSWEKVSNIINNNTRIQHQLLGTILLGVIGERSTSAFLKYLKEVDNGVSAGAVITGWGKKIEKAIDKMNVQEVIHLNSQLAIWFDENQTTLTASDRIGAKYANNLEQYLNFIPPECMAQFFDICAQNTTDGKLWPDKIMRLNDQIADKFVDILNGDQEEELEWD